MSSNKQSLLKPNKQLQTRDCCGRCKQNRLLQPPHTGRPPQCCRDCRCDRWYCSREFARLSVRLSLGVGYSNIIADSGPNEADQISSANWPAVGGNSHVFQRPCLDWPQPMAPRASKAPLYWRQRPPARILACAVSSIPFGPICSSANRQLVITLSY